MNCMKNHTNKRMYPFLEEEFSVMPMGVSEEFDIVRVDMPTQMLLVEMQFAFILHGTQKEEEDIS